MLSSCCPIATIEPIRDVLLQMFMGEKFGREPDLGKGILADRDRSGRDCGRGPCSMKPSCRCGS